MILDRCGGSPLAAKAFGSMLCNRTSMKEWKNVLTRSIDGNEKIGTFAILKLNYDDLLSHLQQCFACYAVFSKDYQIDVEILVQLWMEHEGDNFETVGKEFFKNLTWRSFFQEGKQTPKVHSGGRFVLEQYARYMILYMTLPHLLWGNIVLPCMLSSL
ncbi:hypothetical protein CFC21_010060 [Triticum aestivum]|uniref:Disease resistance protein winged helix domain-containing protein n=2 Tax=Triticum aestivum TaxID=4565 RepID=A0A9R1IUB9_WHEAT|nr:hypothetical protein CFC21_010060 [Triticum aestivum]